MDEEKEQKNKFVAWFEGHPKTVFWSRFVLWTMFAAGLPFAFIAWRYGIFKKGPTIQLSGWGVLAVVIAIVFIFTMISYLRKGLRPGLPKQCVTGFLKVVVPLVILLLIVVSIEKNITLFKQALCCTIACEAIAIPINPFPAWVEKKQKEEGMEKLETMGDVFWHRFFNGKKEEEKDKK